jgi:D-sedoheptulose 7-phosphate isomerase
MKNQFQDQINLINKVLSDSSFESRIDNIVKVVAQCLNQELPVLVCGNGGSASDALHITGELVGRFNLNRKAQNVICLNSNVTVITAWSNDNEYDTVFSRQVEAHGKHGGVCWGLSTSGNSKSVILAFKRAKELGMTTIGFTGEGGGELKHYTDFLVDIPSNVTPRIQELHLPIYHYVCERVEVEISKH